MSEPLDVGLGEGSTIVFVNSHKPSDPLAKDKAEFREFVEALSEATPEEQKRVWEKLRLIASYAITTGGDNP